MSLTEVVPDALRLSVQTQQTEAGGDTRKDIVLCPSSPINGRIATWKLWESWEEGQHGRGGCRQYSGHVLGFCPAKIQGRQQHTWWTVPFPCVLSVAFICTCRDALTAATVLSPGPCVQTCKPHTRAGAFGGAHGRAAPPSAAWKGTPPWPSAPGSCSPGGPAPTPARGAGPRCWNQRRRACVVCTPGRPDSSLSLRCSSPLPVKSCSVLPKTFNGSYWK